MRTRMRTHMRTKAPAWERIPRPGIAIAAAGMASFVEPSVTCLQGTNDTLCPADGPMMDNEIIDSGEIENVVEEKKEDTVKLIDHVKEKKCNREEKGRRKDDKRAAERYLKGLRDVHTTDEKLEAICRKYSETIYENRQLQMAVKQAEKNISMLLREKERCQGELTKAALARKRLESLCRELQKDNKFLKEHCLLKIKQGVEVRKDVSTKLQSTFAGVTTYMNRNLEKDAMVYERHVEMSKKCKRVYDCLVESEERQRTKHEALTDELLRALTDKSQLLNDLAEYREQVRELQLTEAGLRRQLSLYTDKYDECQTALDGSNKMDGEFNGKMEWMSRKILTLEKEANLWKQRWEKIKVAQLDMATEKEVKDEELATLSRRVSLLQDLCKMFQRERTGLLAQLREKTGLSEGEIMAWSGTQKANLMIMAEAVRFYANPYDEEDGARNETEAVNGESKTDSGDAPESSGNGIERVVGKSKASPSRKPKGEAKEDNVIAVARSTLDSEEASVENSTIELSLRNDDIEKLQSADASAGSALSSCVSTDDATDAHKRDNEELTIEPAANSAIDYKDVDEKGDFAEITTASRVEAPKNLIDNRTSVETWIDNGEVSMDVRVMGRFRDVTLNGLESPVDAGKIQNEEQHERRGDATKHSPLQKVETMQSDVKIDCTTIEGHTTDDLVEVGNKLRQLESYYLHTVDVNHSSTTPTTEQQFDVKTTSDETVNSHIESWAEGDGKTKAALVDALSPLKDIVLTQGPTGASFTA